MNTTRLNQKLWIDAAQALLIESGASAITILALSKQLGTSRTSFYWLFKDRDELLEALITRWEEKNTQGLIKQSEKYAASIIEAILNVHDCWFDSHLFDTSFEYAMRAWSQSDEHIAARVKHSDSQRMNALKEMFERHDYSPVEADVRARTVYLLQIGYITTRISEPPDLRLSRIAYYVYVFTGRRCTPADMERFTSRHRGLFSPNGLEQIHQELAESALTGQLFFEGK